MFTRYKARFMTSEVFAPATLMPAPHGAGKRYNEGMTVALDLLSELARSDGHLKHYVLDDRVSLYNGMGNAQLSQPVTEATFKYLLDNDLIVPIGGRETRIYKISDAGKAKLSAT